MSCICDVRQAVALEKEAIVEQKISVEELMDMAGKALANEVAGNQPKGLVVIVCGKGNNAGDGFVAARYLNKNNIAVKVITLYKPSDLSKDAFKAYERLPQALIKSATKSFPSLRKAVLIVDAIFGFSFKPPIAEHELKAVKQINKQNAVVISADVPSGLDASTGFAEEENTVKADQTICFSCIKKGLLINKGPNYAGKIKVAAIGIKPQIINKNKTAYALDVEQAKELLPERKMLIHKKSAGRVLVIGGSAEYTGAPVLAAEAALRSGAGFVVLAVPNAIKTIMQQKTTEIVVEGVADTSQGTVSFEAFKQLVDMSADFDSIALGPGLTTNEESARLAISFLTKVKKPVVIDADGLNALAVSREAKTCLPAGRGERREDILEKIKTKAVLTPHAGELARLTGLSVNDVEMNRFKAAKTLASNNITVLLKGRYSVVASKDELLVNLTSNPGMATAGTGDVLTGIIAAFIAQGLDAKQAAVLGAFVHGLAGDIAAKELSEYALIASDLIEYLPDAFKSLMTNEK